MSKTTEIEVWDLTYQKTQPAQRSVTEILVTTPDAILHFKIKVTPTGRATLYTQVKAMAKTWWPDRHVKMRREDMYQRMNVRASQFRTKVTFRPISDFDHLMKHYDLEQIVAGDEKARNAVMTAMGHHGALTLHEIMDKAVETTKNQRDVILKERAIVKAQTDQDWGMF